MPDPELEIRKPEDQFPPVSGQAFADARLRVLASGQSVLQTEGGAIYKVSRDGSREFVKTD